MLRPTLAAVLCVLWCTPAQAEPLITESPVIQPGAELASAEGCTGNFIYDGTGADYGRVFIGLAAHCVRAVGDEVLDGAGFVIGHVAAMGTADEVPQDWALVEIFPELHKHVDPALVGHPDLPRGTPVDPALATFGDAVQFDGWGTGFEATPQTRQGRTGRFRTFTEADGLALSGLVSPGDSGGPIVHLPSGGPIGILTELEPGTDASAAFPDSPIQTASGPAVLQILAQAAVKGLHLRVRAIDSPPVLAPVAAAPAAAAPGPAAKESGAKAPVKAKPKPKAKRKSKAKRKPKAKAKRKPATRGHKRAKRRPAPRKR
jgi:hypothetical protein